MSGASPQAYVTARLDTTGSAPVLATLSDGAAMSALWREVGLLWPGGALAVVVGEQGTAADGLSPQFPRAPRCHGTRPLRSGAATPQPPRGRGTGRFLAKRDHAGRRPDVSCRSICNPWSIRTAGELAGIPRVGDGLRCGPPDPRGATSCRPTHSHRSGRALAVIPCPATPPACGVGRQPSMRHDLRAARRWLLGTTSRNSSPSTQLLLRFGAPGFEGIGGYHLLAPR